MTKRTFLFAAIFAALISASVSVQAADLDYYWLGGGDVNYWTNTNWRIGSTSGETPAAGSMNDTTNSITAYILNASSDITFNYDRLGSAVVRLNLGQAGNTNTAVLNRSGGQLLVQDGKTLAIGEGGTLNFNPSGNQHSLKVESGGTLLITGGKLKYTLGSSGTSFKVESGGTMSITGGTFESDAPMNVAGSMSVSGGTFAVTNNITVPTGGSFTYTSGHWDYANTLSVTGGTFTFNNSGSKFQTSSAINVSAGTFKVQAANSFRIGQSATATVTISGGELISSAPAYLGIGYNSATINQSNGSATFNGELSIGWTGYAAGHYNLTGGTLTTEGDAGLCNYGTSNANTFTMEGGTANFNKTGESFTIGMGSTNTNANVFSLYSGTVNAADTFAIKFGGTLNVARNGETGGDGVLNAKKIEISNGTLNLTSGTINLGEGGITNSSGSYAINLGGGTFGTNGVDWSTSLNATVADNSTTTFAPDADRTIIWNGAFVNESQNAQIVKDGAGTLKINSSDPNDPSKLQAVTVNSGELDYKGYLTGNLIVKNGAVMSPCNSVGTADVNGKFTLESGATLLLEQDSTGMDLLKATSFDVASGVIDLEMGAVQPGKKYAIIQNTSRAFETDYDADFWTGLLTASDREYWKLSVEGDTVFATIDASAVPEPSTWLLLALGAVGLLCWRKKK